MTDKIVAAAEEYRRDPSRKSYETLIHLVYETEAERINPVGIRFILGTGEVIERRNSCLDEACNIGKHPGCWKTICYLKAGLKVVLDDGQEGILENPRGCHCGPGGEPCWDISTPDSGGGIQAHGGTFRLKRLTGEG